MELIQIVALVASLVSLAFAAFLAYAVVGKDEGSDQIRFIGKAIQEAVSYTHLTLPTILLV